MPQYHQTVDIQIQHDWTKTMDITRKVLSLKDSVEESTKFGYSDHYDLGQLGNISDHRLSESWYRISSRLIRNTMPWLPSLLDALKELGPDQGDISYLSGDAGGHIDQKTTPSALNYIFYNTDPDAHTWIRDESGYEEIYPSIINTSVILNAHVPHGIKNNGDRWALSIHFNSDYETTKQWFNRNPLLKI